MSDPKSTPIRFDNTIAIERAKLARFISAAFSEPDPVCLVQLADPEIRKELRASGATVGISAQVIESILDALAAGSANQEAYVRLLGHTVRSECPPYELEYRSAEIFQQSQTLADVAGFYHAFGFDASGPVTEREDHAATQWEFLAVLSMKAALAQCEEDLECCVSAQRAFLKDHAAMWMPAFFERIRKTDSTSVLARTAELADAVLRQWCADLGVAVGPRWLELRPISDEDSNITCGAPGAVELGPTLAAAMEERH